VDFLGGVPFRFHNDRRTVLMVIGEDEYKTDATLPAFAQRELEPRGFQVRTIHADAADPNRFPGLAAAVPQADAILISVRRRTPAQGDLNAIRQHLANGKPLVGIRTASHAFSLRDKRAPIAPGSAIWPEFDAEVLGGHYTGHHGDGPKVTAAVAPGAAEHPILRGINPRQLQGCGSLYKVVPLAGSTTPVLMGSIPNQSPEPIAWTNTLRISRARVFYTSLGHWDDFENPEFRKLLVQGLCWTLDIAAPGSPSASVTTPASN
jgi:type 1 glutamine amidotransferase